MHLWRGEYGPFMYMAQMKYCRRVIVVPLSAFHRMAEQIGDPDAELIFLFNTTRCGSTLVTQVFANSYRRLKRITKKAKRTWASEQGEQGQQLLPPNFWGAGALVPRKHICKYYIATVHWHFRANGNASYK